MTKSCWVWPGSLLFWILKNCLTMRCLWKKLLCGKNLHPYFLSCSVTELINFSKFTKASTWFSICCYLNVREGAQAAGIGMSWMFFSFFSLNLFNFSCSSLIVFLRDLASNALILYVWEACCWDSLAFFAFLSSVAFDPLPQAPRNWSSSTLLNFNTFCINLTVFEDGSEADSEGRGEVGNGDRSETGNKNRGETSNGDGNKAERGERSGTKGWSKGRAAIVDDGSTGGSSQSFSSFYSSSLSFLLESKPSLS